MRSILRDLALRVALLVLVAGVLVGLVTVWVLEQARAAAWIGGEDRLPVWLVAVSVTLAFGLSTFLCVGLSRAWADRSAEAIAGPLRHLAHRTDEMSSGGFALDPLARPGRLVVPEPWRAGIREIDALSREIDHHHQTLARALVSERSFASDASHQLRTPLSALLLRLEEIASLAEAGSEVRAEADLAISQVERLSGVVSELLRRTRAGHASGGALSSVDSVLAGLDEEWGPAFEEVDRRFVVRTERGMVVEASAPALSQILNTLVENALQHGQGTVRLSVTRSGPSALVTVTDQGPGIAPAMARSLFDRAVTSGAGTGLGLAVARETAESVGGRLELAQVRPAVFAVYLPLADTP